MSDKADEINKKINLHYESMKDMAQGAALICIAIMICKFLGVEV